MNKKSFPCVAASILNATNKVKTINDLVDLNVNWIHYDVMDGNFVQTVHLKEVEEIKEIISQTKKHIVEIHLMVNDIFYYIDNLKNVSDYFTFHYEAINENVLNNQLKELKDQNLKIGLAINPSTEVEKIFPFLNYLTHVLIMSVVPGKGGQKFIEDSLNKVEKLKKYVQQNNLNVLIGVDGGIDNTTGPICVKKGVDYLVSGSFLINNLNEETIKSILFT